MAVNLNRKTGPSDRGSPSAAVIGSLVLAFAALTAGQASAQNAVFQNFFFDVCANPAGALATRCAETPGAGGNLSGDSESSLNPSQALSASESALAKARERTREILEKLEAERDQAGGQVTAPEDDSLSFGRWSLLFNHRTTIFDQDRDPLADAERGFDGETYSFQFGADTRLDDRSVVGAIFSYDRTETEFDRDQFGRNFTPANNEGANTANNFSLTAFGSYSVTDGLYVDASAGVGVGLFTFERNVVFQETNRVVPQTDVNVEGDTEGLQVQAGAGVGYDLYLGAVTLGPYARMNFVHNELSSYTEDDPNNTGLAMVIDPDPRQSFTATIGARAAWSVSADWGVWVPQARAEFEHEFDNDPQITTTRFVNDLNNNTFTLVGDEPDRDYWTVGFGMLFILPNGWMPFVDYEALLAYDDLDRHRFTAGLRAEF